MRLAFRRHRGALFFAALLGWLTLAGPAVALTPEVKDSASLFMPETVRQANALITEIKQQHKKDLLIETFAQVPEGTEGKAVSTDGKISPPFFRDWAAQRAREAGVNGIYVLVCQEPSFLQIAVGNDTRTKAFPDADRQRLSKLLLDRFKQKEFDGGLLEAVRLVQSTLQTNLAGVKAAHTTPADSSSAADTSKAGTQDQASGSQPGSSWWSGLGGWLIVGLVVGLGVWLVIALIRAFTGGAGGLGGGGFLTSLLGGLVGAAAGMWLYNSFFGGSEAQAGHTGGEAGAAADQDYSTGGGGDFGGGDPGGEF